MRLNIFTFYNDHELKRFITYVAQHAVMFDGSVQDDILMLCRYAKPIQEKEKQKRFERAIQIVNILPKILNQEAITLSSSQVT